MKEDYGTLSETISELAKLGYTHDFNIQDDFLVSNQENVKLSPNEFQIDKVFRFEGMTDPEDQSILYAISAPNLNMQGTLVNGYGIYTDEKSAKLITFLETNQAQNKMQIKTNSATPLRPEGNRILNAPWLQIHFDEVIEQIRNEVTWTSSDRNSVTIFKSETLSIVVIGMHNNAELIQHKAKGAISIQVLEGKIQVRTELKTLTAENGQLIILQEKVDHSVLALTESFFLLTLAMGSMQ